MQKSMIAMHLFCRDKFVNFGKGKKKSKFLQNMY